MRGAGAAGGSGRAAFESSSPLGGGSSMMGFAAGGLPGAGAGSAAEILGSTKNPLVMTFVSTCT